MKTRKLKDLKENERICVENEKQAKGLRRLLKKQGYSHGVSDESVLDIDFVRTNCHHIKISGKNYYYQQSNFDKSYPASDFIKPKKSKLKKVWQEIARMDGRIADLEDKNKNPNTGLPVPSECETKELEVGKWYKYNEWLLCYTRLSEYNILMAYGFDDKGNWREEGNFGNTPSLWIEATKEEVKSALIAEAKRIGFKDGVKILSPAAKNKNAFATLRHFFKYEYTQEDNCLRYWRNNEECISVFQNGKWAKIIQEKEIDWSVPQLMRRDKDNVIVQTTGIGRANTFDGLVVLESGRFKKGLFASFNKQGFDIFNGSITLKNE